MTGRKRVGLLTSLVVLGIAGLISPTASNPGKTRVVLARSPRAVNERNESSVVEANRLFERALLELTGAPAPAAAWKTLGLTPQDTVAVKVNCNHWTVSLSPHPPLLVALCRSLQTIIPANRIIIFEAAAKDLVESGFRINLSTGGVRYFGADQGGGYDPDERLTRIVTHTATKIINLASLKCVDGDLAVSIFFKNQIGSLVPEDMAKCHDDQDFLAAVSARPSIKGKTMLNICDGLRGTYRRGVPWYWAGIILGVDPVAAEAAAIGVINEKRSQENLSPLPVPGYLQIAAEKYRLGTRDPNKIELKRLDL